MDRSLIIRGPAILAWKGCTIYTKDSIELKGIVETFDVETSLHGKVDVRTRSRRVEVTFTPSGMVNPTLLTALYPYGALPIGSSIFANPSNPAQDNPLAILTTSGKKITLYAAAITRMPSLTLSATQTVFGSMTFTGIRKNAAEVTAPFSFYQVENQAWNDPGAFDRSQVRLGSYVADWAETGPWHAFETLDGWQVDFHLSLHPIETDCAGLIDMTLGDLEVTATCKPMPILGSLGEAELLEGLALQGMDAIPGTSLGAMSTAHDLVIRHGVSPQQLTLTLSQAALKESGLRFGRDDLRNHNCTWIATRTNTTPLFSLSIL